MITEYYWWSVLLCESVRLYRSMFLLYWENIIYIYFYYIAQYCVLDIYDIMMMSSCVKTKPRNTIGLEKVGSLSCTNLALLCL